MSDPTPLLVPMPVQAFLVNPPVQNGVFQRWNTNYGQAWTYNQIPTDWRDRYNLDANDRYYYRDGYVYQVDPRTRLVEQVLSAIIR